MPSHRAGKQVWVYGYECAVARMGVAVYVDVHDCVIACVRVWVYVYERVIACVHTSVMSSFHTVPSLGGDNMGGVHSRRLPRRRGAQYVQNET